MFSWVLLSLNAIYYRVVSCYYAMLCISNFLDICLYCGIFKEYGKRFREYCIQLVLRLSFFVIYYGSFHVFSVYFHTLVNSCLIMHIVKAANFVDHATACFNLNMKSNADFLCISYQLCSVSIFWSFLSPLCFNLSQY